VQYGSVWLKWIILVSGILCNAFASVLVKIAVTRFKSVPGSNVSIFSLLNWPLVFGVVLYGLAFLLYAAALARIPLNVAHPVLTSGAILVVAILSFLLFREPFYWTTGLGILMIILGVILIAIKAI
jgi:multidrug transporter EmrE-like cation transporter